MRDINLLPPKQKQKRLALSIITYITFGFLLLLVTVIGFAVTLTTIQVTITDNINTYTAKREAIEKRITSFKSLETDITNTNSALELATSTLDQQLHPTTISQIVSDHVGNAITLTSLALSRAQTVVGKAPTTDLPQLTIAGNAKERADVIDFKRALEATTSFNNVTYTIGSGGSSTSSSSVSSATTASGTDSGTLTFTITTTVAAAPGAMQK